ncbi:MAG: DUF4397 domain-containing protein [bacterium]
MSLLRTYGLTSLALLACACSAETGETPPIPMGSIRLINASSATLSVVVDGQTQVESLGRANVSSLIYVSVGSHTVALRTAAGASASLTVSASLTATVTAVALPTGGSSISANVIVDTGTIVPAGKSKLRVLHMAAGAQPLEIWRTQPDFHTPVHIMTPFLYQAQSPYLQSDPGEWEVWVTAPNGTTKIATTGSITVPDGQRKTVVLLDSAGVVRFRIIDN